MNESAASMEQRILSAVKLTLTGVIRDTATPVGMPHPLSAQTIADLRQCLVLISARERELAIAVGNAQGARPHYVDEPAPPRDAVVRFHKNRRDRPDDS